ncbi:MAG: hypothetical protein RJA99_1936 [Pseudomonadota bacterium]|jgi:Zn-dependent protease with chaperone function
MEAPDRALDALWFDGRVSRPRPVSVAVERGTDGPVLRIEADGEAPRRIAARDVDWPPRWSAGRAQARVVVGLRGLGSLELADPYGWQCACDAADLRVGLAQRMQVRWAALLGVALMCVAVVAALHRVAIPWVGETLARHVPVEWELAVGREVLAADWLKPTALPADRQEVLRAGFEALRAEVRAVPGLDPGYAPRLELHFRRGIGPNAFALPGGPVILTDELVERAAAMTLPDDAVLGVLAHEIGHVVHRHGTRMAIEQGVMNVGIALALGDLSTLTTTVASTVAGLAYQRGHETQSDCFAIALMARAGRPTAPMADLLLDLGRRHGDTGGSDWLSTHPSTPERAERLRRADAADCAR